MFIRTSDSVYIRSIRIISGYPQLIWIFPDIHHFFHKLIWDHVTDDHCSEQNFCKYGPFAIKRGETAGKFFFWVNTISGHISAQESYLAYKCKIGFSRQFPLFLLQKAHIVPDKGYQTSSRPRKSNHCILRYLRLKFGYRSVQCSSSSLPVPH